jgi:hypothetical protein
MVDDYEPQEEPQESEGEDEGEQAPAFQYTTLLDWMDGWFFRVAFRLPRDGRCWCDEWWRHRYAIERLSALWLAWEMMYKSPQERSSWWIYHFEPHFAAITSQTTGPFRDCDKKHEETAQILPHFVPPTDWPLPALAQEQAQAQ